MPREGNFRLILLRFPFYRRRIFDMNINSLPKELHVEIFSHLSHTDHIHISKTCHSFAQLVRPFLFDILHLSGDAQDDWFDHTWEIHHYGRRKTTFLGRLSATVDEIISLDIARYVKHFKFSPAQYVENFWTKYRNWIIEQIDAEMDHHAIPDDMEDGWDEDREFVYLGLRKVAEDRQSRAERERSSIERAEKIWAEYVAEQKANENVNEEALARLVRAMPNLRSVEIGFWSCDLSKHEIFRPESEDREAGDATEKDEVAEDDEVDWEPHSYANYGEGKTDIMSQEVGNQFSRYGMFWTNFTRVARALLTANHHVQELVLPEIDPQTIKLASPAVQHTFSGLTRLTFSLSSVDFLLQDDQNLLKPMPAISAMIRCAQPTLQFLDISFSAEHFQLPSRGEHNLAKLLYEPLSADDFEDDLPRPLVFPCLKELKMTSLIAHVPSLTAFLTVQPSLETVSFHYFYLGTPETTWTSVALSLPPSCRSWYVCVCGHRPTPIPDGLIAYNWIGDYRPYTDVDELPVSSGWRLKDPFCDSDPDPQLWFNQQAGQDWLLAEGRRRRMTDSLKLALGIAAFERVEATGEERIGEEGERNRKKNMRRVKAGVPANMILPEDHYEKLEEAMKRQNHPFYNHGVGFGYNRQQENVLNLLSGALPAPLHTAWGGNSANSAQSGPNTGEGVDSENSV